MITPADILVFKRNPKDKVAGFLSWVLQKFEPSYKRVYWHTAPVTRVTDKGVFALDAHRDGAQENLYSFDYIEHNCKVFHWFDIPPSQKEIDRFVADIVGTPYDFKGYFGTIFFSILARITGDHYRIHDEKLHCWEITSLACRVWGKPLQKIYEYPLVSSMLRVLGDE